jgi:hypothetical protein
MNKPVWVVSKCVRVEHNGKRIVAVDKNSIFKLRVIGHGKDASKMAIAIEEPCMIDPPYLSQNVVDRIESHPDQNFAEFLLKKY